MDVFKSIHSRLLGSVMLELLLLSFLFVALPITAQNKPKTADLPRNISAGLRHLLEHQRTNQPLDLAHENLMLDMKLGKASHFATSKPTIVYDKTSRVLVEVHLNGRTALAEMHRELEQAGAKVAVESDRAYKGLIEAFLPLASVDRIARHPGTAAITLVYRAHTNVGATTSQGAVLHRTDVANGLGFDGTGVTVGLISNSYNTSQFAGLTTTTALQDVLSGDLPFNTSIPGGEGLKFLIEQDPTVFGPSDDEGRAMSQIVHDLAPAAQLCYATANGGQMQFALNIIALATNPACQADVISDDVFYPDEPFFSDGIVAQTVDAVASSGVAYFSSAGNQAFSTYDADLKIIPDGAARALPNQAVDLSSIPAVDQNGLPIDTAGGFQNFAESGPARISQTIQISSPTFTMQWDDPFFAGAESTDLDVLFFDPSTGKFLFAINDDNFMLDQPEEFFGITGSGSITLVISRKGTNTVTHSPATNLATHVRYVVIQGAVSGLGIFPNSPSTFGHNAAAGANSVAAYRYNVYPGFPFAVQDARSGLRPELEYFSSPGPVHIYFDHNNNRLAQPQLRLKPDMAAADGVNTTFFPQPEIGGSDYENLYGLPDGFNNFFGTSAASPHAAGVAALLIQKAGGPGKLAPPAVHNALISSAPARDFDKFFSKSAGSFGQARVFLSASDPEYKNLVTGSNAGFDPNFFTFNFTSPIPGQTVQSITLDLTPTGLNFSPGNFPVTQGVSSGGVRITSSSPSTLSPTITVNLSGMTSGKSLRFGVYRRFAKGGSPVGTGGKAADMIAGGTFTATLSGGKTVTGTIGNRFQTGYTPFDGFGLIDAIDALAKVKSNK